MSRYLYLKNCFHEIVKQELFDGPAKKQLLIDKWRKLYGKKFSQLSIEEEMPEMKEKYAPPKGSRIEYAKYKRNAVSKNSVCKSFNKGMYGYKD